MKEIYEKSQKLDSNLKLEFRAVRCRLVILSWLEDLPTHLVLPFRLPLNSPLIEILLKHIKIQVIFSRLFFGASKKKKKKKKKIQKIKTSSELLTFKQEL